MAGTAGAQTPPEEVNEGGLDEVIVTATRRAENLQDVPESITALDNNAIAVRGLQQLDDLVRAVPGLSLGTREPGGTTIVFRGVASSGLSFGSVSSSALYLDEQPITSSGRNPDPRLIDIERLEALRGPQGTLYGASSQSGTLRVITNKANPSAFESWVDIQGSNTSEGGNGYDISAMVNLPLADEKLALRLVGFTSEDAGFIDNVLATSDFGSYTNANVADEDVNVVKTKGGRASLRWDVSENLDLTLGALFQDVTASGHGDMSVGSGDLQQVRFEKESLDDKWYQVALTLNASLPFADAVVSASYFDRDFRYEADATAYEAAFYRSGFLESGYVAYDFGPDPRGFATNHEETQISTFEARLQSPGDSESRWGWIVGTFYSKETGDTAFDSYMRNYAQTGSFDYFSQYEADLSGSPLAPTDRWFLGRYDSEFEQQAVFGELSFDITERFEVTAGGRWFDYTRDNAQIQQQPEGFSGYTALDTRNSSSEDGIVKKLNFTYKHDRNKMLYATYSEGFRAGGANQLKAGSGLPRQYDSDTLKNYEVGAKTEWLDRRLRLNLAVYDMKWEDIAVQIEDPQPFFQLGFVNLPSATIKGVEGDFAFTLTDEWQIDGTFSRNDSTTEAAVFTVVGDPTLEQPDGIFTFEVEAGARLPLTPDWSASLGIEYRPSNQVWNAQPFARFDVSHIDDSTNALRGIEAVVEPELVAIHQPYEVGDLRFGLEGAHWSGSLFIDNLWDERAELYVSNRWRAQRVSINRPRTIGIQVRYNF